jgi:hypothetical protein
MAVSIGQHRIRRGEQAEKRASLFFFGETKEKR